MSLPTQFKPKSFWERPEGTTGMIFAALLGAAAIWGFAKALPFLIALFENTLHLALLGTALFAVAWVLLDKRFWTLLGYCYKSLMRFITGLFIQIDPIGILKSYAAELRASLNDMDRQIGNLRGQMRMLQQTMDNNASQMGKALKMAGIAKAEHKQHVMVLQSRQAGRLQESNLTLQALFGKMEMLYRVLLKMHETSSLLVEDIEAEIDVKSRERAAIKASHSAFRQGMKIIRGDTDKKALFDQTLEYLAVGGALFGGHYAIEHGLVPKAGAHAATIPQKADYADNVASPMENRGEAVAITLPSATPARAASSAIRMEVMAWNAQMGLMLANGGPATTEGSLMQKQGVNLKLIRQDDTGQMQNDLIAFANELAEGNPQPAKGAHFVVIMGDGSAAFFSGLNQQLARLGPDYTAQIVGAAGYSRGEDKCMGLKQWKDNPNAARGALIAGVLRDGDWNICLKWAGDNSIANNPDEKTYDPNALNWVATDTFVDAGEKYLAGYCETRKVVRAGQPTGDSRKVCVNGVATWTPVDVTVAQKKGGLVSLASTRDYRWQMPAVIIGNKQWMAANRSQVENMLAAMFEAGDQIKASKAALHKAAEVNALVYKEQNADYWQRYY